MLQSVATGFKNILQIEPFPRDEPQERAEELLSDSSSEGYMTCDAEEGPHKFLK